MQMFIQIIVAGIATVSFSILFGTPRKEYIYCGITGVVGWFIYLLFNEGFSSVILSTFFAALVITILSRIYAVNRRVPVLVFLIAGIFPLVPGTGIYFTSYYVFLGDMSLAGRYGRESLGIALAIAFGIMIVFLVPQKMFNYRKNNY